jgi:hypothetical protein
MQSNGNMWVTDLLDKQPSLVVPVINDAKRVKITSIHERVQTKYQAILDEKNEIPVKKKQAQDLRNEAESMTKRYQTHKKLQLIREAEQIEADILVIESGEKACEFLERAQPYIQAYQRQQFCRPVEGELVAQRDISALEAYNRDIEGIAPKFCIEQKDICKVCNESMHLHITLSLLVCTKCGKTQPFLDANASLLAYNDDSYDYANFSYKRMTHFREWLQAIQAKEGTDIPEEVLRTVMDRLKAERVQENDITVHKVREVLKKLKLRKYYEHIQLITTKLTGNPPPRMTPEQEERIKLKFMAASNSFQKLNIPGRKNFLSYSLVILKCCELLGYTDFLPFFGKLKGHEKLLKADIVWQKICEDLGWPFIPST